MNKKTLLTIVFISVFLIILGLISPKIINKGINDKYDYKFTRNSIGTINFCEDKECIYEMTNNYEEIKINTNNKDILKLVDKLNKETKDYYNKAKASTIEEKDNCVKSNEKVTKKLSYRIKYEYYNKNGLLMLHHKVDEIDSCNGGSKILKEEVFTYDLSKNKFLDKYETIKYLNLNEEDLVNKANESLKELELINNKTLSELNFKNHLIVYYDELENLTLSCYIKELEEINRIKLN